MCGLVGCVISQQHSRAPIWSEWYRDTAVKPYPWPIPPVVGVDLYREDAVVLRGPGAARKTEWYRAEVKEFSKASRRRLAFIASNTDVRFTSMLTLTYPKTFPNDGKDVKKNLNALLVALKRKVDGVKYLWFLEFQKRGAPHIHLLLRGVRVSSGMQQWMSQTWYRICKTGDILHLRAGTRLELIRKENGARNYATKYAWKTQQKVVPKAYRNVGRFWGASRCVTPILRSHHRCTNDDLVGALDVTGWDWQQGDTIRYKVLFGAAKHLKSWTDDAILELGSSG